MPFIGGRWKMRVAGKPATDWQMISVKSVTGNKKSKPKARTKVRKP